MDLKGFTTVDEVGADDSQVRYQENFIPATTAEEINYFNEVLANFEENNNCNKGKKFGYYNDIEGQNCKDNEDSADQKSVSRIIKENQKSVYYDCTRQSSIMGCGKDIETKKSMNELGIEGQKLGCESDMGRWNSDGDSENEGHFYKVQRHIFGSSDLSHVEDIMTQVDNQQRENNNENGQVVSGLSTEPSLLTMNLSIPLLDSSISQWSDSDLSNPNLSSDHKDLGKISIGAISSAALNETGSSELSSSTSNATIVPVNSSFKNVSMLESRCYSARDASCSCLSGKDVSGLTEKDHKDLNNELTLSSIVIGSVSSSIDSTMFPQNSSFESSSVHEAQLYSARNTSNKHVSGLTDKIPKDLNNELTFSNAMLGDTDNILAISKELNVTGQEEGSNLSRTQIGLSLVKSEPVDVDPQEEFDFDGFLNDSVEEFKVKLESKDESQYFSPGAVAQDNFFPVKILKKEEGQNDQPNVIPNVRYLIEGDREYSREQITAALIISQSSCAPTIDMNMFQNVGRTMLVLKASILEEMIMNLNKNAIEDVDIVKLFVNNYGSSFSEWKKFFNFKVPSSRKHRSSTKRVSETCDKNVVSVRGASAKGKRSKETEKELTSKKIMLKTDCYSKVNIKDKACLPKKEKVTKRRKRKRKFSCGFPNMQTIKRKGNLVFHVIDDLEIKSSKDDSNSLVSSADLMKGLDGDRRQVIIADDTNKRNKLVQESTTIDMKKSKIKENFAFDMIHKSSVAVCLRGKSYIQEQIDSHNDELIESKHSIINMQAPSIDLEGFTCDERPLSTAGNVKDRVELLGPKDLIGHETKNMISYQCESMPDVDLVKPYPSNDTDVMSCASPFDMCLDVLTNTPKEETLKVSESYFQHSLSISSTDVHPDSSADLKHIEEIFLDIKCKPCSVHLFDIAKDKKYHKKIERCLSLLDKDKRYVTQSEREVFAENIPTECQSRMPGTGNRDTDLQSPVCTELQSNCEMDRCNEQNSNCSVQTAGNDCNIVETGIDQNSFCSVQTAGNKEQSHNAKGEKPDRNRNIMFIRRNSDLEEDNYDGRVIIGERDDEDASEVKQETPEICTESICLDGKDIVLQKSDNTELEKEDKAKFEKEIKEKKRLKSESSSKRKEKEEVDIEKLQEEIKELRKEKKVLNRNKVYDHVNWKNEKIKKKQKKLQEICQRRRDCSKHETNILVNEEVSIIKELTVVTPPSLSSFTTFRIPKKKGKDVSNPEALKPTSVLSKREEWLASRKSFGYSSNKKLVHDHSSLRSKEEWNSHTIEGSRNETKSLHKSRFPPQSRMREGQTKKEMHQIPGGDSPVSGCDLMDSPGLGTERQQCGPSGEHETTVPFSLPSYVDRWVAEVQRKGSILSKSSVPECEKLHARPDHDHDVGKLPFHIPPPPEIDKWGGAPGKSMNEFLGINSVCNESGPANSRSSPYSLKNRVINCVQTEALNMSELKSIKGENLIKVVDKNMIYTHENKNTNIIESKCETLQVLGNKDIGEIKSDESNIVNQYCHMDKKQKMRVYEKLKRQYYEAKKKYHVEKGERKQSRYEEYERRKKEYYDLKLYLYEEKKKEYDKKKKIRKEILAKLKAVMEDAKLQTEGSQKNDDRVPEHKGSQRSDDQEDEHVLEDGPINEGGNAINLGMNGKKSLYSQNKSPATFDKHYSAVKGPSKPLGGMTLHEFIPSYEQDQKEKASCTAYEETTTTTPAKDVDMIPSYEQMTKETLTCTYEGASVTCSSAYEESNPSCRLVRDLKLKAMCSSSYKEANPSSSSAHESELKGVLMSVLKSLRQSSKPKSRDETSVTSDTSDFVSVAEPVPSSVSVQSSISWPLTVPPPYFAPRLPSDKYPLLASVPSLFSPLSVPPPLQVTSPLFVPPQPKCQTPYPTITSSIPSPYVAPPVSVPCPSRISKCAELTFTSTLLDSSVISTSEQSSALCHTSSQIAGNSSKFIPSRDNCMMIDSEQKDSHSFNDTFESCMGNNEDYVKKKDDSKFLEGFGVHVESPLQIEENTLQNRSSILQNLISKLKEATKQDESNTTIHRRQGVDIQTGERNEETTDISDNTCLRLDNQRVIGVQSGIFDVELCEGAAVERSDGQDAAERETLGKPNSINASQMSIESTDDEHIDLEVIYSSIQKGSKDKKRTLGDEVPKYYQKMPLAQTVVDDCKDIPLVGLQYVLEVRQDVDVTIDGCYYICAICSKKMNAHTLIAHIKSVPHRLKFSEIHCKDVFEKYGTYSLKQWTAVLVKEFTMALAEVEAKMGRHKIAVAFEKDMSSVLISLKDKINEISELSSKPKGKDVEESGGEVENQMPPSKEEVAPETPTNSSQEPAACLPTKEPSEDPPSSSSEKAEALSTSSDMKEDNSEQNEKENQPQETNDEVVVLKDVKKATGQGFQKRNYRPGPNSRRRSTSKSPSKSLSPKRTRSKSPSSRKRKSRSPSSKRTKSIRHSSSKESGVRSQTGDRKRRYSRSPGSRSHSRSRSRSRGNRVRRSRSRSHSRSARNHRRSRSRSRSRPRSVQRRSDRWFRRSPPPRRREPSEERNKRVAERKLQDFREAEIRLKARLKNEQEIYEKNPESHPQYNQEWKMFWEHRCQQLVKQGLNPFQYDFKSEWALFWPQRMRELLAILYKSKRNSLLVRFNTEDPDENKDTSKTTNNETNTSWNSAVAKRGTISRIDRSPSPWEGDERNSAKVKNPSPPAEVKMPSAPTQSVEPASKKFEEEFSVLGTLKLLNQLEDQLGSFGPAITTLLGKAVYCSQKGGNALELFKDPDNLVLVRYAREKLSSQISAGILGVNALVCTQMAVERAMWLQSQAEKLANEGKYLGLDIGCIARATLGKDTIQIAQFIAQQLLQVGKSNASEEDLQNILFAVSAAHTKIVVEQAVKQTHNVNPNVSGEPVSSSFTPAPAVDIPQKVDDTTSIPQKVPHAIGIPQKPPTSSPQELQRPKPLFPSAMSASMTTDDNDKSSDTKSAGLSMLQSAYDDENAKDMEKLSIEDLQALLANFRSLVPEEQQALTAYLKKLEATDSKKVMKLREEMHKNAKNAARMAKPTSSITTNSHQTSAGLSKDVQRPSPIIPADQHPAQAVPPSQPAYSGMQNKVEVSKPPLNYTSRENNHHSRSPPSISEAFREFASDHPTNNPQDNLPYRDRQNSGPHRPFMEKDGPGYSGSDSSHQRYQESGNQNYYNRDHNKPLGPNGPLRYGNQNYFSNYNKSYPPRGNQFPNNPNRLNEGNWYNERPHQSYGPPDHF